MDRWTRLNVLVLICLSASVAWMGFVAATPAPSRNTVIEPGWSEFCTDMMYQDGTTPVDHPGQGGSNTVGTAGEDWGVFLNAQLTQSHSYCFEPGTYLFSTPILAQFTGAELIYPSIIGPAVGAGSGTETLGTSAVVFQASNTFPSGEFLLAYLPDVSSHETKGAAIQNLEIMCKSPGGTKLAAGVTFVNARQYNVRNISLDFCITPNPTTTKFSGASQSATFSFEQIGSPGGFDYVDNISATTCGQDCYWLKSAESTFVGLRSLGYGRDGFNVGSFDMSILGSMVDSGGASGGNTAQVVVGGDSNTRFVGFNSFAGPTLGGPTIEVLPDSNCALSSQTGHPVFVDSMFNGPQQSGLGDDNGAIVKVDGCANVDFIGVSFVATANTYHFVTGRSDFNGTINVIGGSFDRVAGLVSSNPAIINEGKGSIRLEKVQNYDPLGKITNMVHLAGASGINSLAPFGTTQTLTASTDYTIDGVDQYLTSTGGTGVSITIKDNLGNTIWTPGATLSGYLLVVGYKINFGGFSGQPTLTDFAN